MYRIDIDPKSCKSLWNQSLITSGKPLPWLGCTCNCTQITFKSYLLIACILTLGVDLVPIKAIHNVITIQEDITTDRCRQVYGCILLQRIVVEFNNWKIMINFIHLKHNQTSSYNFYQACTKSYTPSLDRMPAHPSPRYFIKFPSQFSTTNDLKNFCCS